MSDNFSTNNQRTLATYDQYFQRYVDGTPSEVTGLQKLWLEDFVRLLPDGARVFEVGSATGRDARFLRAKGAKVEVSDATDAAVKYLRKNGFPKAGKFNVLTDDFPNYNYDGVLASAVFLHFRPDELRQTFTKIHRSLKPGGLLAFSLKIGVGEETSYHKMDAPRYFHFWQPDEVRKECEAAGYEIESLEVADGKWLMVILRKGMG